MKFYFNGCSLTYGDELQDPQQHAWPVLVSKYHRAAFCNDAVRGGTNERTVYKTLLNADDYDFFFIAWTNYIRFTEYNPIDNFEINFNPNLNLDVSLHHSDDLKKNYKKYKTYGELYYKHWCNDLYEFKKWLQQIILLQSFFDINDKKYIMLNSMNNNLMLWLAPSNKFNESCRHLISFFDYANDDQLLNEHQQIQKLISLIDLSKFIEWNQWCIQDLNKEYPCGPNGHILELGHQAVAKKVLEHYNQIR